MPIMAWNSSRTIVASVYNTWTMIAYYVME